MDNIYGFYQIFDMIFDRAVLGQSERSTGVNMDAPNDQKWTVSESGRSWYKKVDRWKSPYPDIGYGPNRHFEMILGSYTFWCRVSPLFYAFWTVHFQTSWTFTYIVWFIRIVHFESKDGRSTHAHFGSKDRPLSCWRAFTLAKITVKFWLDRPLLDGTFTLRTVHFHSFGPDSNNISRWAIWRRIRWHGRGRGYWIWWRRGR